MIPLYPGISYMHQLLLGWFIFLRYKGKLKAGIILLAHTVACFRITQCHTGLSQDCCGNQCLTDVKTMCYKSPQ